MKTSKAIIILTLLITLLWSCKTKEIPSTVAYTPNETECLGMDPSGAVRLRVFGVGKDNKTAAENAKKTAVETVLFTHVSGAGVNLWPVIDNPSVRRSKRLYFDKFFKDGGEYKKYIKAEKKSDDKTWRGNDRSVQAMEIIVDREKLINKLTKDKILQ